MPRADALFAGLFFATNPFLVAYSIVPYQEILMLAGLAFAFHFFFAARWFLAAVFLGLACLTRYEAWIACPVLASVYVIRREKRLAGAVKAALLFGWAPLVWILYNRGIGPKGTFLADSSISPARLVRDAYIAWIALQNTPIPVLCLAALGLWAIARTPELRNFRYATLAAFLGIFLVAIPFSPFGDPRDPERFVSAREAHLPIAALILLAGTGLARAGRLRWPLAAAGLALGIFGSVRFVAQATAEPDLEVSYRVAQYLNHNLGPQERALLLAKPVPPERLEAFVERAFRQQGEVGRRGAQEILEQIDTSPMDYQRTLVHSRLGRDRLLSRARSREAPQWVVVWGDFQPSTEEEAQYYNLAAATPPVATISSGPLTARICRLAFRTEPRP